MARVSEVFSVNQHASICGGFGPCPDTADGYSQWDAKRRNSVTGAAQLQAAAGAAAVQRPCPPKEIFPLCGCKRKKYFNNEAALTELNKFDDLMRWDSTDETLSCLFYLRDGNDGHDENDGNLRGICVLPRFLEVFGWERARLRPCHGGRWRLGRFQKSVVCGVELSLSLMGVSENSVPLNPMVNDHYPY